MIKKISGFQPRLIAGIIIELAPQTSTIAVPKLRSLNTNLQLCISAKSKIITLNEGPTGASEALLIQPRDGR